MRLLAIYMCVFDTKVAVGGCAGGSGCFAGGRRWRLRAGGDNGPAHTPASRGTHMHACMHAWDHLHAWAPAACPPHSRVPRPGPRAHGFRGRTAQSRITARHADAFLLSPYMSSPPLFNFWVHSLPFHRWFRRSLSLSACVCQYSRKLPCYMRRHYFYVTRVQIKARMMMHQLIKGQLSSSQNSGDEGYINIYSITIQPLLNHV